VFFLFVFLVPETVAQDPQLTHHNHTFFLLLLQPLLFFPPHSATPRQEKTSLMKK
jgi:hypothetical protein